MFGCCEFSGRDRDDVEGLTDEQIEVLKSCKCSCHDGVAVLC